MAGCVPCFIIPLLLFIFHRYIQPILLKFWNPWEKKDSSVTAATNGDDKTQQCLSNWSCPCAKKEVKSNLEESKDKDNLVIGDEHKVKTS